MKRTFLIVLSLLLTLSLFGCGGNTAQSDEPVAVGKATLRAVGDIYLTDAMLDAAILPDGSYDFTAQFADVIPALADADLTLANFEGNFDSAPFGKDLASYPDALAKTLAAAGIDLLQTANTYSIFNGIVGMERTKSVIEAQGMTAFGTYTSAQDREKNQVVLREVNGIRIAFVAFTKGLGGMGLPTGAEYCVNLLYTDYTSNYENIDYDGIRAVMKAARAMNPDLIVASLHWGSEDTREVSKSQENIANLLIDCGADLILGSHSHLAAPIEERAVRMDNGEDKTVVIAYGLGDLSAVDEGGSTIGVMLDLEITKDSTGDAYFSKVNYRAVGAVDRGEEIQNRYRVLDIDSALALYEANYYDRVSSSLYESLKTARERLEGYVHPAEEETE